MSKRHGHQPTLRCECEHEDHFPQMVAMPGQRLGVVMGGHAYGVDFPAQHIEPVRTPYGTYAVCPACAQSCLASHTYEEMP